MHELQRQIVRCFLLLGCCLLCNTSVAQSQLQAGEPPFDSAYSNELYRAYIALGARPSDEDIRLHTDMFIPLMSDDENLLFADIRGQFADVGGGEGNAGLAFRHLFEDEWIWGVYGFYDLKQSGNGNWFSQGTLGTELLSAHYELRGNLYIPESGAEEVIAPTAVISNGNLVVQNNEERAYHGFDLEAGALLWRAQKWCDSEIRGFAGTYYFDTDSSSARTVAGPRLRAEWRSYDLPWMGQDSRLTVGAQYQHDDVRGGQTAAILTMRLPLGSDRGRTRRRTYMQRRMTDVIVRDIDVVTRPTPTPDGEEVALHAEQNFAIGSVTMLDADTDDLVAAVAAATTDTIIIDGAAGEVITTDSIIVPSGQNLLGGGFMVRGAATGIIATVGTPTQLYGSDETQSVIVASDNTRIGHFDIEGGLHGISSYNGATYDDLTNVQIFSNRVSVADDSGFRFAALDSASSLSLNRAAWNSGSGFEIDDNNATLTQNTSQDNAFSGFYLTSNDGTLSTNRAMENGEYGFVIGANYGDVTENEATENRFAGFAVVYNEGLFSENESTDNASEGFRITTNNGTVSENFAFDNFLDGFWFEDNYDTISDNTSYENYGNGFVFNDSSGSIVDNYSGRNSFAGFVFRNNFGDFNDNTSQQNGSDGFDFSNNAATMTGNSAIENTDDGYDFSGNYGTFSGNFALSNLNDGFQFYRNDDQMTGNIASDNLEDGFYFNQNNSLFDDNYASGNYDDGIDMVENFGTVSNNLSIENLDEGYTGTNSGFTSNNTGYDNEGGGDTF
ncbi:right-handed parallel beta-helix repeat-containing protein [Aporhodopirellula aestuarii]|uniref:right-handed parallel beta-helix repeat-containing protein n=1 Tax=Aporhodopirellula aestuarii TaxID=2950107 RepID=UPI0020344CE8|nr:right-handed parallel beta-helix repeat-containing protein [Aporhodopirellula aestuarii]